MALLNLYYFNDKVVDKRVFFQSREEEDSIVGKIAKMGQIEAN